MAVLLGAPSVSADDTYHNLAGGNFSQNWSNIGQFTTEDNWADVPSIVGYDGTDAAGVEGSDPCLVTDNPFGTAAVAVNQKLPSTLTSDAVGQFTPGAGSEVTNAVVGIRGQTAFDAPFLLIHLNSTGRENINIQYNLEDIDHSNSNALSRVALQWRVGNSGPFTTATGTGACILDATEGPGTKGMTTAVNVTLPAGANDQAQLQVRIMTYNAAVDAVNGYTSADEWIGIDDIVVSSTAAGGPTDPPPTQDPALDKKVYLPHISR